MSKPGAVYAESLSVGKKRRKETMSTPQTSRELADRIVEELTVHQLVSRGTIRDLAGCEPVIAALIDAWVREREATAHAAAIQAASIKLHKMCVARGGEANGTLVAREIEVALTDITPAASQRLYDLRIAEAVRDEAKWWWDYTFGQSQSGKLGVERLQESRERLASANAEVERLKAPANV